MIVKNLKEVPFDEIVACFLEAFENYYVKMPSDQLYYKHRWEAAKVDFELSYGMFDNDKLVGFIIHGIDGRRGVLTAFNTGTGVIAAYRGRKIVKSIYDYAINDLLAHDIERCTLEVIVENEIAIKAYESIGFKICKAYKCYAGDIKIINDEGFELQEIDPKELDWKNLPRQHFYSWDFQKETILRGNYKAFQVLVAQQPESFFILNTENHYVGQFDVLKDTSGAWSRLFSAIKSVAPEIKVINVDVRLREKLRELKRYGLENTVNQYEMELNLNSKLNF